MTLSSNTTHLIDTPFLASESLVAIIPAAGSGQRMKSALPKQYLHLGEKTLLAHTADNLLSHPLIKELVILTSQDDTYFATLPLNENPRITRAIGGQTRAESVLAGLKATQAEWVLVHDAARPCLRHQDLDALIKAGFSHPDGALLATPVKDTMKRADAKSCILYTESREQLWHALTPQMFKRLDLLQALEKALNEGATITDEASAMEWCDKRPLLVQGHADNIKVTLPEDLALAEFILSRIYPKSLAR